LIKHTEEVIYEKELEKRLPEHAVMSLLLMNERHLEMAFQVCDDSDMSKVIPIEELEDPEPVSKRKWLYKNNENSKKKKTKRTMKYFIFCMLSTKGKPIAERWARSKVSVEHTTSYRRMVFNMKSLRKID